MSFVVHVNTIECYGAYRASKQVTAETVQELPINPILQLNDRRQTIALYRYSPCYAFRFVTISVNPILNNASPLSLMLRQIFLICILLST